MPRLTTTAIFSDYPKVTISQYREQLRREQNRVKALSINYRGQDCLYDISLRTTKPNYGGVRN